jgi:hypothetical protein
MSLPLKGVGAATKSSGLLSVVSGVGKTVGAVGKVAAVAGKAADVAGSIASSYLNGIQALADGNVAGFAQSQIDVGRQAIGTGVNVAGSTARAVGRGIERTMN